MDQKFKSQKPEVDGAPNDQKRILRGGNTKQYQENILVLSFLLNEALKLLVEFFERSFEQSTTEERCLLARHI